MKTLYPYTSAMPVSAKFYARICERVNSVVSTLMVPNADRRRDKVLRLIHDYLTDPVASAALLAEYKDNVCNVIFLTLRAELDAAIERSRRARARAAGRRALGLSEKKPDAVPIVENPCSPDASAAAAEDVRPAAPERPVTPIRDAARTSSAQSDKSPVVVRHRYGVKLRQLTRPNRRDSSKRRFKK